MTIPTTLTEAVDQLIAQMDDDTKARARAEPADAPFAAIHHGCGTAMRNDWGLWHGETGISRWLREHRIVHGDDQSQTIYTALWRRLHDLPIDDAWLAEQAAFYEHHWAQHGLTWDQKPHPDHKARDTWLYRMGKDGRIHAAE